MKNTVNNLIKILALTVSALMMLSSCGDILRSESTVPTGTVEYIPSPDHTTGKTETTPAESESEFDTSAETEPDTEITEDTSETEGAEEAPDTEESEELTTPPVTENVPLTSISVEETEVTLTKGECRGQNITFIPENTTDKSFVCSTSSNAVASIDPFGNIYAMGAGECTVYITSASDPQISVSVKVTVEADETEPTLTPEPSGSETEGSDPGDNVQNPEISNTDGITYIGGILIANKTYALPESYNPGIDATAYSALNEMFAAAGREGITLWIKSGFRSYSDQKWQYNYYVSRDGVALADTYSARPGHSEHQTGLAFDINSLYKSFADTPEGIWLAANCYKYGFIIRYPAGKEHITGYMYEPWHIRYLGVETATAVYESGLCLEEYLGITSSYNY